MKLFFNEEQKENELNQVELEDFTLYANWVEGEGNEYLICGTAIIDGETFKDFLVDFTTLEKPENYTIEDIMDLEWDFYDYRLID